MLEAHAPKMRGSRGVLGHAPQKNLQVKYSNGAFWQNLELICKVYIYIYKNINICCCFFSIFSVRRWDRTVRRDAADPHLGETRPPRGVMCKIWRLSNRHILRYAPETKCWQTAQCRNIIQSFLWTCVLNSDWKNIITCTLFTWNRPTYQILLSYVIFFKSYRRKKRWKTGCRMIP